MAVGAMTIITSTNQLVVMPVQGICQGAQPIISYNYGANKKDRVKKAFFLQFKICVIFTLSLIHISSLCPITGQPDFATITISYVPDIRMVESKSLKLYLFSFRNHGDFHEDCVNIIMKDLIKLMEPKYIEVWGKFTPRGGISIDPYCCLLYTSR